MGGHPGDHREDPDEDRPGARLGGETGDVVEDEGELEVGGRQVGPAGRAGRRITGHERVTARAGDGSTGGLGEHRSDRALGRRAVPSPEGPTPHPVGTVRGGTVERAADGYFGGTAVV